MSTENLLLEIGTEEIPSGYFNHILDMLSCKKESPVRALFEAQNIRVDKVSSYSTPRRIILHCEDIPINQNIVIEGPPKRIAYGEDGTPTKALEAFVGKNNASLEDVEVRSSGTEERVILKKENVSNGEVLKDLLPKVIKSLDFPKSMRWDEKGVTFARPIRWILALFGKELLEFSIGDIQSCNVTHGHRFLGKDKIRVRDAGSYFRLLDRNHVVWDNERRKQKLLTFLQKKRWHENPALLDEVNNIVEFPFFLEGVFKEEYLKLPKEVLLASMAKHQRVFCLKDKQGNLTNRFVAVLNGNYKGRRNIRKHYEEVLDARLKDALFFYGADTKKDLSKIAAGLKDVIFHKELGTLKDKVERVKDIALFLTHYIKIDPDEKKYLGRAVSLCKADLLTQMVREFPSLQGTVGKYYAAVSGEDDSVCEAIGEHYLPRFGDDEIPQTALGGICSLADKFDNIVSYFKIGKFPKGSWDLYALRRQAIGIISILIKMDVALSLSQVFDHIYMASPGASDKKKLKEMLLDFFKERFISFVKERFSYRYDLIDAVVTGGIIDNVQSCFLKLESLNSIIDEPYFENARCVVERTYNIVKSSKSAAGDIKASLLKEPQEHRLHDKLKEVREDFKQLCAEKRYGEATKLYAETFSDETHEFFDKVMVNVNDRSLKNNRIALLEAINKLYVEQIADLSKVVVQT